MKTKLSLAAIIVLSLSLLGDSAAFRKQCCHGCGGYYCKKDNCGSSCKVGPNCRGCWTSCAKSDGR